MQLPSSRCKSVFDLEHGAYRPQTIWRHIPEGCNLKRNVRLWQLFEINEIIGLYSPCRGGLEYCNRSPANDRRRRKGNPVPGGITGLPCHWGT
jgi:hypothetical protein